jgi:biopolymer transport protein ExbB
MRLDPTKDRRTTLFGVLTLLLIVYAMVLFMGPVGNPASVWAADESASTAAKSSLQDAKSPSADAKRTNEITPTRSPENTVNEKIPKKQAGVEKRTEAKTTKGILPAEKKKPDTKELNKKVLEDKDRVGLDEKLDIPDTKPVEKDEAAEGPAPKESFLIWLYRSLGTRYVVIFLIITFNLVALVVMILLGMRRKNICPDDFVAAFEAKLNEKKYQEAYDLAKANRSFIGKVLTAGMAKLPDGYDEALRAMQEVGENQNMKMEQRNGYIALIAQIGPMFGLLGTVDGMVMAFDVIAHSNVTPKPSELAQGIGTALVTTVVGLWIAIPAIAFFHIVRNRLSRLVGEVGAVSGNLMKRFAGVPIATKKIEK